MSKNTFGRYEFDAWVPEHVRELIRDFWGQMGRTHKDWMDSPNHQGVRELCHHGPGPNGFGMPPNGATIDLYSSLGKDSGIWVRGRYIHCWNNIGRVIDERGDTYFCSTGDRWVRVWQSTEERDVALAPTTKQETL